MELEVLGWWVLAALLIGGVDLLFGITVGRVMEAGGAWDDEEGCDV